MRYRDAFKLIKSDYNRYAKLTNCKSRLKVFFKILVHERGFAYTFWLRLATVKSPMRVFFWLVYHHLSSKYGIQISTKTHIGSGLYIGHGHGVIINPTSSIGNNVSLSQFLTIGSNKGKAAIIEDNVYIGPNVCLVEDIVIGHDAIIGAGAIVTKSVPPGECWAGVPARRIR